MACVGRVLDVGVGGGGGVVLERDFRFTKVVTYSFSLREFKIKL